MKLYNCLSEREMELKETDLKELDNTELLELTYKIKYGFEYGSLEDEEIVIDALAQIAGEFFIRCEKSGF